ncbi:replication initiator protein A (plasmid) [Asticcacaulis sp. DW145]|uniref:replication initiator protein A n=1 Tax=Asticcacaulis sp. DW145 TaxID=3095608 RepID=UPI0030856207|nr:replication initiator protein A [Asticcacaulis sp. DW145]
MSELPFPSRSPLLPERHQPDFFVADIFDATPKGDQASMEHPLFTLSTKPDMQIQDYRHGDIFVKVGPSPIGRATVHDRDILIYCISQCMARLNEGREVKKTMRFNPHDLMVVTNRDSSGRGYLNFRQALKRLQGTQIETNIQMGGKEQWNVFSFIDKAEIIRETRDGRMQEVEITLSDWLFDAIEAKGRDLLTLHRDYFRLRKPLERRLYEIARKHCGQQKSFRIGLERLQEKTGSQSQAWEFKRLISKIIEDNATHGHIPQYDFVLDGEFVDIFKRPDAVLDAPSRPYVVSDDARLKAKKFAKGWDIYALEAEWRDWVSSKGIDVHSADAHFINFAKQKGPIKR